MANERRQFTRQLKAHQKHTNKANEQPNEATEDNVDLAKPSYLIEHRTINWLLICKNLIDQQQARMRMRSNQRKHFTNIDWLDKRGKKTRKKLNLL